MGYAFRMLRNVKFLNRFYKGILLPGLDPKSDATSKIKHKINTSLVSILKLEMAEPVGFEPTMPLQAY
jgi:hypothetical protein